MKDIPWIDSYTVYKKRKLHMLRGISIFPISLT